MEQRIVFLLALTGTALAGAMAPGAIEAAIPCPPPTLSAHNGSTASTACSPANARSDWQARIGAPGVVWYNGFDSASEVNVFRWAENIGNDPNSTAPNANYVSWVAPGSDGPASGTFGYLSQFRPAGGTDNAEVWWRPFSPMTGASNGKGVNDPADGGAIPLQTWNPNSPDGGELQYWTAGWYSQPNSAIAIDGQDFYMQFRVKMDPKASAAGAISPAKLMELGIAERTLTAQNIVTYLNGSDGSAAYNMNMMYMDYNFNPVQEDLSPLLSNPYVIQVGGDKYAAGNSCVWNQSSTYGNCWSYDLTGGWDTLLYHITPGSATSSTPMIGIQVWGAHQGQTSYQKIWDIQFPMTSGWQSPAQSGWQALYLAVYSNGAQGYVQPSNITSKYAQIIFSKQFINCPQY
jgi:hypothetical protein